MKKKLFFFASLLTAAAATLGLTSCSNEMTPDQPIREGMVDVVMTTSMPQELESYAVNSAQGGLQNLEDKGYSVRYIMEIYPKNSTELVKRVINYESISAGGTYKTTTFSNLRLLAAEYNFVFFADIVRKVNSYPYNEPSRYPGLNTPYYANRYFFSNTETGNDVLIRPTDVDRAVEGNLQTICASAGATDTFQNPYLEMYDAYTETKSIDLRTDPTSQNITLKRPFAKLRLITTDADELLAKPDWSKSRVDISGSTIPTGINALTGATLTTGKNGYWNSGIQALNSDVYSEEEGAEKTLSVFYLPVPANSQDLTFTISVKDKDGNYLTRSLKLEVNNVPLVGNKLTTIKGKLLSKQADVKITIDDAFEDPETVIDLSLREASSVEGLMTNLQKGSNTVTYTGRVDADHPFTLDFSQIQKPSDTRAVENPLYAEGNTSDLILNFSNMGESAVITFKGGKNAPKNLHIITGTKCSLRIDLPNTDVNYDGSSYKYIITNSGCQTYKTGCIYDALFVAGEAGSFYSEDMESHDYHINADFTLPENLECGGAEYHEAGTCNFIDAVKQWLSSNSKTSVWDYVGAK